MNSSSSAAHTNERSNDEHLERLAMGVSEMVLKSPTEKAEISSKLSADAPEFVPGGGGGNVRRTVAAAAAVVDWTHNQQQQQQSSVVNNLNETNDSTIDPSTFSEAEICQYLFADIQMYLQHLQSTPANFDYVATQILDLLIAYAYDEKILTGVVDQIFRAGIDLPNFTYQCARLCAFLADNYWSYDSSSNQMMSAAVKPLLLPSFRNLLITRCRVEHQSRLSGPSPHIYNYALFLADLYNQVKVDDKNLKVLGLAILEIVHALLDQANDGNVACAVRVLKCCGATLELSERREGSGDKSPQLDALFSKFEQLLQSNTSAFGLSEDGKLLIRNLLSNRGDWHKYSAQQSTQQANDDVYQQQQPDYQRATSDPVFFGPDGEALTAEEAAFLEQELGALQSSSSEEDAAFANMFSPEDDAIDDAYEEFLKMTEEKKRQQQQQQRKN